MKKTMKKMIALTLVLVLTLSLFAGCNGQVKTSDEYLLSEYGMTFEDASVTYNGLAQGIEVSVDSTLSAGKSYTVTYQYEKNGTAVDASDVVDVGTYEVQAHINDGGDEDYILVADFTITQASLSIKVSDQYVRTGSNATSVTTEFADLELLGSDTISSIGLAWDVDDIDDIGAMTEVSEGIAIGVEITSGNYALSVSKGTLYVLSYADYTAVGTLALDVSNLTAYNARFDELTYSENNSYSSAAKRVLAVFESADSYTEVQLSMLGSIDQSTIETNKAIADKRTSQGYSLDWDTAGEISTSDIKVSNTDLFAIVAESEGWTTDSDEQMIIEDDDGDDEEVDRYYYDDGFVIDYDGRDTEDEYDTYEEEVKYGDYFYFVILDYNADASGEYIIETITVRNKEYDYEDGDQVTYGNNTYRVYEFAVNSSTLGAIGNNSNIDVIVSAVAKFPVKEIDISSKGEDNDKISKLTISSSDDYVVKYDSDNDTDDNDYSYFVEGEEYELSIYMKTGFTVSQITIGEDFVIDGSMLDNGSYKFTVEEDTFGLDAGDYAEILVETVKSFDVDVEINSRTVRYSDGTYESDYGTVVIDGLTIDGSSAMIVGDSEINIQLIPADDYYVTNLVLYANSVASDSKEFTVDSKGTGTIDLIEEVASDGRITIDFSDDCDYFDFEDIEDATELEFQITFAEKYEFEVVSDDVTFKQNAAGEWVSNYGTISIMDTDLEVLESVAKGELFTVYAELEPGYIISKIKVDTTTYTLATTSGSSLSAYSQDVFYDNEAYYFQNTSFISSDPDFKDINSYDSTDQNDVHYEDIYFDSSKCRLDAGEAITIEVTFDTYYEVEVDDDLKYAEVTVNESSSSDLYKVGGTGKSSDDYVIFGSDDNSKLYFTIEFDSEDWVNYYYYKHHGNGYDPDDDDESDDAIDEVIFWCEADGETVWDDDISHRVFEGSLETTISNFTGSVDFDDIMDLYDPGDVIELYFTWDIVWD